MSTSMIIAFHAALSIWPFQAQTINTTYRQPTWLVTIRRDRFTGATECRVYQGPRNRPAVAYGKQSLAFRFSPRLSTLRAAYRVDTGAAVQWTSVYPTLVAKGANLPGASLENPTGGLVILPLSALSGGHTVVIRPAPNSPPQAFHIDGLADVLAGARLRGCSAESAFVR